jgi:hypothetical protein
MCKRYYKNGKPCHVNDLIKTIISGQDPIKSGICSDITCKTLVSIIEFIKSIMSNNYKDGDDNYSHWSIINKYIYRNFLEVHAKGWVDFFFEDNSNEPQFIEMNDSCDISSDNDGSIDYELIDTIG